MKYYSPSLHVQGATSTYPVYISDKLLSSSLPIAVSEQKICVVTQVFSQDSYLARLKKCLGRSPDLVITIGEGEYAKSMETALDVISQLLSHGFGREDLVIAFGGGVVCDLAGFVASVYQRGMRLCLIPTTLLAQIDASIGSKTALNHAMGKNMIGTFYDPECVLIDPSVCHTLSLRDYRAAFAEAIKCALISDKTFFVWLREHSAKLLKRDTECLAMLIQKSLSIKANLVDSDIRDQGKRQLLNLGHTFGHAIEAASAFEITHGEAVALGLVLASRLSVTQLGLSQEKHEAIIAICDAFKLPTSSKYNKFEQLMPFMGRDKKTKSSQIYFICLKDIGKAVIHGPVPVKLLQEQVFETQEERQ